jgi:hypothetical protein
MFLVATATDVFGSESKATATNGFGGFPDAIMTRHN